MKPLRRVPAEDVPAVVEALRAALAGGPAVWPTDGPATAGPPTAGPTTDRPAHWHAPAGHAPAGPVPAGHAPAEPAEVDDRVALVVETSGSTARPKRVMLSAEALRASAEATAERLGGHGRWLLALPAHYIAGAQVIVRALLAGHDPVVLGAAHFDAEAFVAATARLTRAAPHPAPRFTSLVPVQLGRLVDAAGGDHEHPAARALRAYSAILVGGQALAEPLRIAATELGARLVRTYGSSETAGGCVYDARPLAGVLVRVADGLVELGGPTLADGYLGDAERTAAAFLRDADGRRWYRTGDLGEIGPDGALRIRGRADDVIISGGVKVALGEIERAVRGIPGLEHAVVVAVDDPEWGQRAAVAAAGASVSLVRLAEATDAAGLPPAGRPARFARLEALPMLASGKPDRLAIVRELHSG